MGKEPLRVEIGFDNVLSTNLHLSRRKGPPDVEAAEHFASRMGRPKVSLDVSAGWNHNAAWGHARPMNPEYSKPPANFQRLARERTVGELLKPGPHDRQPLKLSFASPSRRAISPSSIESVWQSGQGADLPALVRAEGRVFEDGVDTLRRKRLGGADKVPHRVLDPVDDVALEQAEAVRYVLPNLHALKFVLGDALGGGVTRTLALDAHGKCLASVLLGMSIRRGGKMAKSPTKARR